MAACGCSEGSDHIHLLHTGRRGALAAMVVALMLSAPALAQIAPPALPPQVGARVPFEPLVTVLAEDFELDGGGFTVGGNASWARGVPNVHVQPEQGQGPNVWGTNLDGHYDNYACGYIESPPIDLTGYAAGVDSPAMTARLLFHHWYHMEKQWDGGVVQASTDGGATWRNLVPQGGYDDRMIHSHVRNCLGLVIGERVYTGPTSGSTPPEPDAWRTAEFDLSSLMGSEVLLRWSVGVDHSGTYLGWYVDDVTVQVGVGARVLVDVPQPDPSEGVAFEPLVTTYAADFATSEADWTPSGTSAWEWGETLAPPHPPTGGLNVWATELDGAYPDSACSYLTSPPIALPGADAAGTVQLAQMSFQLWRHTRSGPDGAVLQASTDGGATWTRVVPDQGYDRALSSTAEAEVRACLGVGVADGVWSGPFSQPQPDAWADYTADLTQFMGDEVLLRFAFASGATPGTARGVYLSGVLVQLGAGGSLDPSRPPTLMAPGWSVEGTNPSWSWGVPTSGPSSTRTVWATNPHGAYNADECSAIVSDPVDTNLVPGLGRLTLSFEHYMATASGDGGVAQVSRDNGVTWITVQPVGGFPSTLPTSARLCAEGATRGYTSASAGGSYAAADVPLQDFDGDTIRVRFVFGSDGTSQSDGWYVRDARLHRGTPVGWPLMTAASPVALAAKADETLRAADPSDVVELVITGWPHENVAALADLPRAAALDALDARAQPFVDAVARIVTASGGEIVRAWGFVPAMHVRVPAFALAPLAELAEVRAMTHSADDSIRLVEPMPSSQSGGVGAMNTKGRQMLQAEDLWALGYRGEGVVISVIDTGIDPTHEAFRRADGSSRIALFQDFRSGTTSPNDDHGHGTHVAATAVGSSDYVDPVHGGFEETGVAPAATLIVAKFLSAAGTGTLPDAISSLQWSYDNGADITSNSWGSGCASSNIPVMQTVRTLTDLGMPSVFAAGNSGPSTGSIGGPACGESAISVGAVNAFGGIADFSSRGPCRDIELNTPSRVCPDIVAKGVAVRSAMPRAGAMWADPTGYRTWDGTSMATPHVAGALALMEQMRRDMLGSGWGSAARHEEQALKHVAHDLGPTGPDSAYGWGLPKLLDVRALLETVDADVTSAFGVSRDIVRTTDTTTITFSVRNDAVPVASGQFSVTVTAPDGSVATIESSAIALGLFDEHALAHPFTVSSSTLPGAYEVAATFTYEWTNRATGDTHTGSIVHAGAFEVKRPEVAVTIEGFPSEALPLAPQDIVWTGTSTGNEPASKVVVEFTLPDSYAFVWSEGANVTDPNARWADPKPSAVHEQRGFGRVTLAFDVGTLAPGESFTFRARIVPTEADEHRAISVVKFVDGGNRPRSQSDVALQTVGVVAP